MTSSQSNRSVRFSRSAHVYLVLSLQDMTDEEIYSTWITVEEAKASQADVVKNVRAMRQRGRLERHVDDDDDICSRGLEHMQSAERVEQRRTNKKNVADAVLDEQDRQWGADIHDDAAIAAASAIHTKPARDYARTLAESDAACSRRMNARESRRATCTTASSPQPSIADVSLVSTLKNSLEVSTSPTCSEEERPIKYDNRRKSVHLPHKERLSTGKSPSSDEIKLEGKQQKPKRRAQSMSSIASFGEQINATW